MPLSDSIPFDRNRSSIELGDREAWLVGQRQAFASALNDAPLRETLGILVNTATIALGEGVRASFFLAGPDGNSVHHIVGMVDENVVAVTSLDAGPESLGCGLTALEGETISSIDVRPDPRLTPWIALADRHGYRDFWSFPINTAKGQFVGTFVLYWPEPRKTSTHDVERIDLVTQTAAIIISRFNEAEKRRQAEHALQETRRQLESELADSELLRQMSIELAGEEGDERLYQKLVDVAARIMGSDVCTVQILHPERGKSGELQMLASTGLDARGVEYWKWVRADSGCTCGEVLRSGKRAIAEDVESCSFMAGTPDRDVLLAGGIRAGQTTPLITRDGKLVGMISTHWGQPHKPTDRELRMLDIIARPAADLMERRRSGETQRLLLNELNHRVKNTLAVVQAIANRTLARTSDPKEFSKSFGGRLKSLARVHDLLSAKSWEGADLHDLIRDQVASGSTEETRVTASGPSVRLDPQMALHLALIFHELGTNATKYGALSVPTGKVDIDWQVSDGLRIRWTERGGPRVKPMTSSGFGTTLISQSVRGQGGEANMTALAEGVIWDIAIPYAASGAPQELKLPEGSETTKLPVTIESLKGRKLLVVEDEALIGMDVVAALEDAGAAVEGPIASVEEACDAIERGEFDAVLLDANLHGRPVGPVAILLASRKIPFAFATGYNNDGLPEGFRDVPILRKPCGPEEILDVTSRLLRQ